MDEFFQSAEDCKQFVAIVVDHESRLAKEQLSNFQRQVVLLSDSENLFEASMRLAEECGLNDGGAEAIKQLREYLRTARKRRGPCPYHPSGLTAVVLLRAVEEQLNPTVDFVWLVLRDSRSREAGKGQKVLVIAIVVVFILGCVGWLLLKSLMLGGPLLASAIVVLLICAGLMDVRNRRKLKGRPEKQ